MERPPPAAAATPKSAPASSSLRATPVPKASGLTGRNLVVKLTSYTLKYWCVYKGKNYIHTNMLACMHASIHPYIHFIHVIHVIHYMHYIYYIH